jgi:hypothetical protein
MKTLLIFPPVSDLAHPPLGIASLLGFLRANDEHVQLLDLNILSCYHLLSTDNLRNCYERVLRRFQELEVLDSLCREEAAEYTALAESILRAEYLIGSIEEALDRLPAESSIPVRLWS